MAMVEKIKNKLRGNGFLLAVTIVLFFVLYIAGAILYGDRNFTSPQVFLNLFISNARLIFYQEILNWYLREKRGLTLDQCQQKRLYCR